MIAAPRYTLVHRDNTGALPSEDGSALFCFDVAKAERQAGRESPDFRRRFQKWRPVSLSAKFYGGWRMPSTHVRA